MPFLAPSPARLPPLSLLLADQLEHPRRIARHLGLSRRTLQRYIARGHAPRAVQLALWFESRWGLSALHEHAFNEAQHARAWVASLERECERLRGVIRVLEAAQARPAANSGVFGGVEKAKGEAKPGVELWNFLPWNAIRLGKNVVNMWFQCVSRAVFL